MCKKTKLALTVGLLVLFGVSFVWVLRSGQVGIGENSAPESAAKVSATASGDNDAQSASPSTNSADPAAVGAVSSGSAPSNVSSAGSGPATQVAPVASAAGRPDRRRAIVSDFLPDGGSLADPRRRAAVVAAMRSAGAQQRETLLLLAAREGIPLRREGRNGATMELYDIRDGVPLYRTTFNRNAAISSGANLLSPAPFSLDGTGVRVGVWDEGAVRDTHQEFDLARVLKKDGAPINDHATHVAGTIAAAGVVPTARGMAARVGVDSYDWDDDYIEMTASGAASAGGLSAQLPISNHSYGLAFGLASQYIPWMGRYEDECVAVDDLAAGLPYYQIFWAAGNDQDFITFKGGYQSITFNGLAKNILTIGAVNDAVTAGQRDPAKATVSSFSSWGPCDDGRIKPDLVANGVTLNSPIDTSDTSYGTYSGTSMATPSAAGSAALLVQMYAREFGGNLMPASMLKALLIHTADDLGTAGPDYKFGWGLINVKAAADIIRAHKDDPAEPLLFEGQVSSASPSRTVSFTWDGINPIRATLCWTDRAGAAQTAPDSRTPNLVHNLDVAITAPDVTTVHRPFVMPFVGTWTDASMALPATTGLNSTDNVEQVLVPPASARPGVYTLTVSYRGTLVDPSQAYSLVVTGSGAPVDPPPTVVINSPAAGQVVPPGDTVALRASASDLTTFAGPGEIVSVEFFANGTVIHSAAVTPAAPATEISHDWVPSLGNYVLEARAVDNAGGVGTSAPVSIEVRYPLPGELTGEFDPPAADNAVRTVTGDDLGRIYVGGSFSVLDGSFNAPRLARLRPTGEPDTGFRIGSGFDGDVRCLLHSAEDRGLYVGGIFTSFRGETRPGLVRLAVGHDSVPEARIDPAFYPLFDDGSAVVNALARQHDGKLLVGGSFTMTADVGGEVRQWRNLVRLNDDGGIDATFGMSGDNFAPPDPSGPVHAIRLQPDGKILVGGEFAQIAGISRRGLVRLAPGGAVDSSLTIGSGFNGRVQSVALAPDGTIYAGGSFSSYNGRTIYNNLVKLSPSGVIDGRFNFANTAGGGLNGSVNALQVRPTGEILVAGLFTSVSNTVLPVADTPAGRIVQLLSDGTVDATFNPGGTGADNSVHGAAVLSNGDLVIVGAFASFNGVSSPRIAVLAGSDGIVPLLTSGQFRTTNAGNPLDLRFTSSDGEGTVSFELVGPGGAVLALQADPATGFLTGPPLPLGVSFDPATGRLLGRPMEAGSFVLNLRAVRQPPAPGAAVPGAPTPFTLHVLATEVSYEQWKQAWFRGADLTDPTVSGPSAVAPGSGRMPNLAIYALWGGSPAGADESLAPAMAFEWIGGRRYLTYSVHKNPLAAASYGVQFSDSLPLWHDAGTAGAPMVLIEETADLLKFRASTPAASASRQFFRLRIGIP